MSLPQMVQNPHPLRDDQTRHLTTPLSRSEDVQKHHVLYGRSQLSTTDVLGTGGTQRMGAGLSDSLWHVDVSTHCWHGWHAHLLSSLLVQTLKQGLAFEPLRGELYCQIVKQVTENPHRDSAVRGWEMMAFCLNTFPRECNSGAGGHASHFFYRCGMRCTRRVCVSCVAVLCMARLPVVGCIVC